MIPSTKLSTALIQFDLIVVKYHLLEIFQSICFILQNYVDNVFKSINHSMTRQSYLNSYSRVSMANVVKVNDTFSQ